MRGVKVERSVKKSGGQYALASALGILNVVWKEGGQERVAADRGSCHGRRYRRIKE